MCKRTLKLFNGRGQFHKTRGETGHLYIAAYSVADAVRLLKEAGFELVSRREIDGYFCKGCWGNCMAGVQPARGVWAIPHGQDYNPDAKPERVEVFATEGYKVTKASPYEVGLIHNGRGVRTWWARDFGGKMPKLDHSLIREAIASHQRLLAEIKS